VSSAVDPGIDGVVGTGDDGTYGFYARTSAANRTVITNDPNAKEIYKGLEITVNKRFTNRWQMLAGYTFSKNELVDATLDTSPNFLINANGNISPDAGVTGSTRCAGCGASNADRPNQFKVTGMYLLPWHDVILSGNFSSQQGPAYTRQISRAVGFATNQIINLEPMGNSRIDTLNKIDVRVGKLFRLSGNRSFEGTVDFDNLLNSDTVWQVRNRTEAAAFTDPTTGQRATLQQFLSPAAILGPRTIVFRGAFKF